MLPSECLHIHREEVLEILAKYPMVSNVRLVGSVARGEDTEESDIDLLLDTAPGATLFDLGGLSEDLADVLGVPWISSPPRAACTNICARALKETPAPMCEVNFQIIKWYFLAGFDVWDL